MVHIETHWKSFAFVFPDFAHNFVPRLSDKFKALEEVFGWVFRISYYVAQNLWSNLHSLFLESKL